MYRLHKEHDMIAQGASNRVYNRLCDMYRLHKEQETELFKEQETELFTSTICIDCTRSKICIY